jgi:hypothetical protein
MIDARVTRDGETKDLPAQWLTHDQVTLLRTYAHLMSSMGLDPVLVCGRCGSEAETHLDADVGIICDCRILVWRRS